MEQLPEEKLKQEKAQKTARTIWMFLIPLFGILALFNIYQWTQGKDTLTSILSQMGMVFVGLGIITAARNKSLSYVFLVCGVIAIFAGLIFVIRNLLD